MVLVPDQWRGHTIGRHDRHADFNHLNGANGINEVNAVYQNAQLSISIDYYLQGGGVGSGDADITELITANVTFPAVPVDFNFYQY